MLKRTRNRKGKKGISEMIAYVILISIALGVAAGIYAWIDFVGKSAVSAPVDCEDGTSIAFEGCEINTVIGTISFKIKNNGRFNIYGVIVRVGNDTAKVPLELLIPADGQLKAGSYIFMNSKGLETGQSLDAVFTNKNSGGNVDISKIKVAQIQPFIMEKKKIVCIESSMPPIQLDCEIL